MWFARLSIICVPSQLNDHILLKCCYCLLTDYHEFCAI